MTTRQGAITTFGRSIKLHVYATSFLSLDEDTKDWLVGNGAMISPDGDTLLIFLTGESAFAVNQLRLQLAQLFPLPEEARE